MNFKYLNPSILQFLDNFVLHPYGIVEGRRSGKHMSRSIGRSLEFVQHREYTCADDFKYIDWKVYARRERFFIKQYYQETNLECWIFLDCSRSMWFPEDIKETIKYEYSSYIVSYLSYILLKQGDSVGIIKFDEGIKSILNSFSGEKFYYKILQFLEEETKGNKTKFVNILGEVVKFVKKKMFLIFISDLVLDNDCNEKILVNLLKQISAYGINILVLHILHPKEYNIGWLNFDNITFKDIENFKQVKTNIYEIEKIYNKELNKILNYYNKELNDRNIRYILVNTELPILENLKLIISQK